MVTGKYRIGVVTFLKGTNTTKRYSFALFDDDVCISDVVLCDTATGYQVAQVVDIINQDEYVGADVTKEIICKVDFSAFDKRAAERKRKVELKKKMDEMVRDDKELMLYRMLAEKNPEMQNMLDEYNGINV